MYSYSIDTFTFVLWHSIESWVIILL